MGWAHFFSVSKVVIGRRITLIQSQRDCIKVICLRTTSDYHINNYATVQKRNVVLVDSS